jgi:hypothetical protein
MKGDPHWDILTATLRSGRAELPKRVSFPFVATFVLLASASGARGDDMALNPLYRAQPRPIHYETALCAKVRDWRCAYCDPPGASSGFGNLLDRRGFEIPAWPRLFGSTPPVPHVGVSA